ncbi:hypothetical protein Lepto7376_1718 [[Leptolyngbya] sp. PCC 7376]|uniref:hypothetical protein n=1 Tax=[Leptolyngbya] sp. PCC 7376 TaxID=111781 RepID=UPI00029F3B3E|nr:hypothetical protein [[Leptolyngbya] sp. PCC 7376]AFY38052.1 hypothetical protein Lepto7376_1718 [[Leptolyngbya] sp. PCC 7376]
MKSLTRLAHQGNVKAIMEILNKQLQEAGVNTRVALGANGILEILCEAGHPENLDKKIIVRRIQHSLDQLSPRPFRQVHIQSCLTNDVQSLWVSTLSCDARRKLLWSENIQIQHRPWLNRLLRRWGIKPPKRFLKFKRRRARLNSSQVSNSSKSAEQQTSPLVTFSPQQQLIMGAIAIGFIGWFSHDWWELKMQVQQNTSTVTSVTQNKEIGTNDQNIEPFNQAVRLANQAVEEGQSATTYGEWLDLANRWQQASELMELVAPNHPRYAEAQERVLSYRQNSEVALVNAKALVPDLSQ